ncbi:MAG: hypothetical protein MUC54_00420 [Chloroflexi bacterium]|nr:hypothetical protein [Chloroflexota bacterium]
MPLGFLRRGKKDGQPSAAPASPSRVRTSVPFDGLTDEWRLVGFMDIEGRLSDALNRREPIALRDVSWAPIDGSAGFSPVPGLQRADPYDLIAVLANDRTLPQLTDAERAALKVHKVAYDVAIDAPPLRILGTVYLYPGSEPERLLDRSTELFLPVIDAVALHGDRPVGDPDVSVVLVNRSYIRDAQQVDRQIVTAARAKLRPLADGEPLIGDEPDEA